MNNICMYYGQKNKKKGTEHCAGEKRNLMCIDIAEWTKHSILQWMYSRAIH